MKRVAPWALVGACLAGGCGARTLPSGDGQLVSEGQADAHADAIPSTDEAGIQFFVCPFSPPTTDSTCDVPGQICVYEGFNSCQSVVCGDSGSWQASQEGC
jgi:hypothetical protein